MPWARKRLERDAIVPVAVAAAGGPSAVARKLGISRAAVGQWRRVPKTWLRKFSKLSGFNPHQLRPDLNKLR